VFIHGLGGSVAQFNPLLNSLANIGPCLALDLPGCGQSRFAPKTWDAYTTKSLVALLEVVINKHRQQGQDVVLICHSMGCSLGALLASSASPYASELSSNIKCVVAICPPHKTYAPKQINQIHWALSIPDVIFNLWRAWDRRGGLESGSIQRFTGSGAGEQLKKLQLRFNNQSRTPVFRRMAYGAFSTDESQIGAMTMAKDVWAGIDAPVLLIAAKDDPVTPPGEAIEIARALGHSGEPDDHHANGAFHENKAQESHDVKLVVFPSPASHALLYSHLMVRPISCLIQNFLSSNVSEHLSLGWQLTYMSTEGKWDVKNLRKWSDVKPVGEPIAGLFRAMKTLREVDPEHNPRDFGKKYGSGKDAVGAVVDISHDSPVYDEKGLEDGGLIYSKCPTVSKLPPTKDEAETFIYAVEHLRSELAKRGGPSLIAVHCHYGFNRTGFFIVSYLVEKMGYPLDVALEEFKAARPPGIRHAHFTDELYGRYFDFTDAREEVRGA
jgi:pimeloyl-ACP methyl ester carboxylesterase/protein-tyrosine phosphatase